eukprot:m.126764 g.126764  ORF g.126764 m.126764 type:complete len:393 (-) comp9437_c0_seq2:446-1624(-)
MGTTSFHLVKHIQSVIRASGPVSVARFMQECLTNPVAGYYVQSSPFEGYGDFTTAPERGQLFGEMLGVWAAAEAQNNRLFESKAPIQFVELGAGSGHLMNDVLRVVNRLAPATFTDLTVQIVEAGNILRKKQQEILAEVVHKFNIKVDWKRHIDEIDPFDGYTFAFANEYFDALPVHQFQFTEHGWRERMVDIIPNDKNDSDSHPLRFVLSPEPTLHVELFSKLPFYSKADVGTVAEVSFDTLSDVSRLNNVLRSSSKGGSAIICDYGYKTMGGDTLRAFKDHKQVHVFDFIGESDVTCDVNFGYLMYQALAKDKVSCEGMFTQSEFLNGLGIETRANMLIKNASTQKEAKSIQEQKLFLTSNDIMGNKFKVLLLKASSIINDSQRQQQKPI